MPRIQPHKLDSVNKCKTNEKKLCKEKSDSSVRLKNRDDINLKTILWNFPEHYFGLLVDYSHSTVVFFHCNLKNLSFLQFRMITYFVYLNTPVDATQWGVVSDQDRFYFS